MTLFMGACPGQHSIETTYYQYFIVFVTTIWGDRIGGKISGVRTKKYASVMNSDVLTKFSLNLHPHPGGLAENAILVTLSFLPSHSGPQLFWHLQSIGETQATDPSFILVNTEVYSLSYSPLPCFQASLRSWKCLLWSGLLCWRVACQDAHVDHVPAPSEGGALIPSCLF